MPEEEKQITIETALEMVELSKKLVKAKEEEISFLRELVKTMIGGEDVKDSTASII